jgi:hypothetical protein
MLVKRVFVLLNAAFAMAILYVTSRVFFALFVILLAKVEKNKEKSSNNYKKFISQYNHRRNE